MNKKNIFRWGIILILTAVLLFFFIRSVEWKGFFANISHVHPVLFVLLVLLAPLHLFTRGFRWKYLLNPEKRNTKYYNLVAGNAVGFTVTLTLPGRLGEVIKPLYLARKENMSSGFVLGTVVVERIFDIFTMVFLLAVFLLAQPLYARHFQISPQDLKWLFVLGVAGLAFDGAVFVFILCLHFFREGTLKFLSFLLRPFPKKFGDRVQVLTREFIEGLRFFRSLKDLLMFLLLSLGVWLAMVLYYWIFFLAYYEGRPFYQVIPYVFLTMVGASIPTPGMVGGFDYFSAEGMKRLYGISAVKAGGMTIVIHALQVIMTCLLGYAILWKERLSLFQLRKMGEEEKK